MMTTSEVAPAHCLPLIAQEQVFPMNFPAGLLGERKWAQRDRDDLVMLHVLRLASVVRNLNGANVGRQQGHAFSSHNKQWL